MLDKFKVEAGVEVEADRDVLGGGGVLETNVYPLTIEVAYIEETAKGATMFKMKLTTEDGRKVDYSNCIVSGKAKGQKSYYICKRTGAKKVMPGMADVNVLCEIINGKQFYQQDGDMKMIKLYDFEKKQDVAIEKLVLTEFKGTKVQAAIYKQIEDKMGKDDNGNYTIPNGTRETNEFKKWFSEDGRTITELNDSKPSKFLEEWRNTNEGKVKNNAKNVAAAPKATAGAPALGQATPTLSFD
jgi:hypothetical protein